MDLNIGSIFWFGGLGRGLVYPGQYGELHSKLIRYGVREVEISEHIRQEKERLQQEAEEIVAEEFPDVQLPKKERLKRNKKKRQRAQAYVRDKISEIEQELNP